MPRGLASTTSSHYWYSTDGGSTWSGGSSMPATGGEYFAGISCQLSGGATTCVAVEPPSRRQHRQLLLPAFDRPDRVDHQLRFDLVHTDGAKRSGCERLSSTSVACASVHSCEAIGSQGVQCGSTEVAISERPMSAASRSQVERFRPSPCRSRTLRSLQLLPWPSPVRIR